MRHPLGVGVDRASAPEASARIPAPAVAPLFGTLTRETQPPAALDGSAALTPPALTSHSRPPLYSATPPSPRPPWYGALPASGEVSPDPSSGGRAPPYRRPSTVYAAKMVQTMAKEEE